MVSCSGNGFPFLGFRQDRALSRLQVCLRVDRPVYLDQPGNHLLPFSSRRKMFSRRFAISLRLPPQGHREPQGVKFFP
jgi:hypothetical protein